MTKNKFIYIYLFLLLIFVISNCGTHKETPIIIKDTQINFNLSGRIIDATNTNIAVKNATIIIIPKAKLLTNSSQIIQTTTDENGLFFFKNIPSGDVIIKITPPTESHYTQFQFETHLIPDSTSSFNITLIPNSFTKIPYSIEIEPKNITISAGETTRFNTIIKDKDGQVLNLTPVYILKNNCGVIYPNGGFTALKEGKCEIVALIQSVSSNIGYISTYATVEVSGTVDNELQENDYFPLGVGFWWKYKQDDEFYYDTEEGRVTTTGTQLFLSKVLGKREINDKECFVGSFTRFGGRDENQEYYTGFNEEYYTKTQDGVYEVGYNDSSNRIVLHPSPRKIIPIPLKIGDSWQWEDLFDSDCDYTLTVTQKEIIDTKLGSYEAFRIDIKLCEAVFGPRDYLRFWVAKGIGWIKDEEQIGGIDVWDEEGDKLGEATWHSISLLIDYDFPKFRNNDNYLSFSIYPLEYKIQELKKKKKERIRGIRDKVEPYKENKRKFCNEK